MSTCPRCGGSFDTGTASFTSLTSTDSTGLSLGADRLFAADTTGDVSTSTSETVEFTDLISGTPATQQDSSLFELENTGLPLSSLAQTRSSATPFSSQSLSEVARTIATPPTNESSTSLSTAITAGLPFSSLAQARSSATPFSSQSLSEVARTIATPPTDNSSTSFYTVTTAEMLKALVNEVGKDEPVPEKGAWTGRSTSSTLSQDVSFGANKATAPPTITPTPTFSFGGSSASTTSSSSFSSNNVGSTPWSNQKTFATSAGTDGEQRSSRKVADDEGKGVKSEQFRDTNVKKEPKVHQSLPMATTEIVQKSVEATFNEMKKYSPKDYTKIEADPRFKASINEAATRAAREQVEFHRLFLHNRGKDVVSLLKERLSMERIQMIEKAFTIPTFDMTLKRIRNEGKDVMLVEFKMEDEEFRPPLKIETPDDINGAKVWQYASIAIEGFMFLETAAGFIDDVTAITKTAMKYTAGNAATRMKESSQARKALDDFVKSWRTAGSDYWKKGKAVYVLLKDSLAHGLFWTILESWHNRKEMSQREWAKTFAQVTATMFAAFGTGGRAFIAQIVLALMSADSLRNDANRVEQKIRTVTELEGFEKNLQESKKTDSGCVTF